MISEELTHFVKEARAAGQTDGEIQAALLSAGWKSEDVAVALQAGGGGSVFASPQTSSPSFSPRTKRYRTLGIALITLGALIIISGGVWAYVTLINPSPEDVLVDMFDALGGVESVAYVFNVEITGPDRGRETEQVNPDDPFAALRGAPPTGPLHVAVSGEGKVDAHKEDSVEAQSRINLLVENSGMFDLSASIDSVVLGDTFYFRFLKAPVVLFFDLSTLEGKWFYVTAEEAKERAEGEGVDTELTEKQEKEIEELITDFSYIKNIE